MRKKVASGITGVCMAIATTVVTMIWPTINPQLGAALLALCGIGFVIAGILWFWPGKNGEAGFGTTVTTQGSNSPGFGTVHGNVTITNGASQPLESQLSTVRSLSDRAERLAQQYSHGQRGCPEVAIWWALHRIAARIGETNSADGFPEARRQLRQAALSGQVEVWGQQQIDPTAIADINRHRDVWSPVPAGYWNDYKLSESASNRSQQDAPHTEDERQPNTMLGRYWNLKIHKNEINRRWPKPPQPASGTT